MRILYLGQNCGTSGYRAAALVRLGHQVRVLDPARFLPALPGAGKWSFWTGGALVSKIVERRIIENIQNENFDTVWVDGGALVTPALVREFRRRGCRIVNYNHDDPFGPRDWTQWRPYRDSVPEYDLLVVVRHENIEEAQRAGARKILHVFRSADEIAHAPRMLSKSEVARWATDVLFVGTWMPERGPFMSELVSNGIPLAIYGNRWQKAREWRVLKSVWRGPALDAADDYASAIQSAKICLGLLSKGNRDLHTTRSLEIPALGGLLLAERTSEHLALYREDVEVVLWSDVAECVVKCRRLLADDDRRRKIALAGQVRATANGNFSERMMNLVLSDLCQDKFKNHGKRSQRHE